MRMLGPGTDTAERADVHNTPACRFLHQPRGILAAEKDSLQIHRVDEVPIGFSNIQRIERDKSRGVIDQAVEAAELPFDFPKHADDFRHALEVGTHQRRATGLIGGLAGFRFR